MATLFVGLRADSRIKMKLTEMKVDTETFLMMQMVDKLSILIWQKTEDGHKNRNQPPMLTDLLNKQVQTGFNTGYEFEKAREKILERRNPNGN